MIATEPLGNETLDLSQAHLFSADTGRTLRG